MKKYFLTLLFVCASCYPVAAWELSNGISLDNSIKAQYNVDTTTTAVTMESGVTVPVSFLDLSVDADFDLTELSFSDNSDVYQGIDIGLAVSATSNIVLELNTGIDTDWNREDLIASMTWSF